jgi:tRNA (mo5U34)-methyltransferase
MPADATASGAGLAAEVASARWYHAMRLPGGIVTPGDYDLEDAVRRIPFPSSLDGKRCLDVGTRDGFWAFEMERRGASEVVAIDLDDPDRLDFPHPRPALEPDTRTELGRRASAFDIAHRALGSGVDRRDLSVYDLSPAAVGHFDFAFIGTLLLHLRDPIGALSAIGRVLRGHLLSNDPLSLSLSVLHPRRPAATMLMRGPRPFWWVPNHAARSRMVEAAGFEVLAVGRPHLMRYGSGWSAGPRPTGRGTLAELAEWLVRRRGAPHSWVAARTPQQAASAR